MRNKFGKRMTTINEGDIKEWKNTYDLVLHFLKVNGESKFGPIFVHVNSNVDFPYSRKGIALMLIAMVDEGVVKTRRTKQGHFLYSLSNIYELFGPRELPLIIRSNCLHCLFSNRCVRLPSR